MPKRISLPILMFMLIASGLLWSGCVEIPKIPGAEKIPGLEWLGEQKPPVDAHGATTEEEAEESGADDAVEEGLDDTALLPPEMRNLPYEEVEITTSDKVVLYGRLYDPSQKGEDAVETESDTVIKYPLVILMHGLNRTHYAWGGMPAALVKAGYAVFALDARGHGKSTKASRKRTVTWRLFQKEDWQKLPDDISQVIHFFQKSEDYPQADGFRVILFGESLGANVVMMASKKEAKVVNALVLLSPGMEYKGLAPSHAIVDYPNAALIMASQQDEYSYHSAEKLYRWFVGPKKLELYETNIGIGSEMLMHQSPDLKHTILEWAVKQLPPTPITVPITEASEEDMASEESAAEGESASQH